MMTMNEMRTLMETFSAVYTDVRLLDADAVETVREGAYTASSGGKCYACEHKKHFARLCAAKQALVSGKKHCRIEVCGADVMHITALPYQIEGRPYVLELIQRTPCQGTLDADSGERIMRELSGYNTKLYRDALTGAYNRRYYEDVVRKMTGPSCVAVMDLDDFKLCNDTYGHHAGDLALEAAANAIRSCVRDNDALIRFGGDEFLLILHGIPGDYLKIALERVRAAAQNTIIPGFPHLHLSLSIGGVAQNAKEPIETAIRRADKLMYQAKMRKNAVVCVGTPDQPNLPDLIEEAKPQILIVDDSAFNRELLTEILHDDYRILEAEDGRVGLAQMQRHRSDISLVLLDINMPAMNGFEVLAAMNDDHSIEDVPVIMISSEASETAIRRSYELGASDYINRPFDSKVVYSRVSNTLKLYARQRQLVRMVSEQIRVREKSTAALTNALCQIIEFRNGENGEHIRHIHTLTELLLNRLLEISDEYHLSAEQQDHIPLAAALHDVGKIAIDEAILHKPGRLTAEEFEIMKTHSARGADMLRKLEGFDQEPLLQTACEIARWHHERWDGRGYPDGLKGNEIPIGAQIVSLADVYDALTSERCYKEAYSGEKAMHMILSGECGAFNPLLLRCLTDVEGELRAALHP